MDLKIDPEFEALIPPSNEYGALEKSIVDNGYDNTCPIRIWKGHDLIVDGYNRFKVCKEHDIVDFTILEMEFDNREAVRDWMYREQLTRRNLDKLQKTYFMGMVYKAEKKPTGTNQHTMAENEGSRKSATQSKQSTAEKVGKLFHVSHETVKEAEKFANAVNDYAKNSEIQPYQLLSTFSNEIKTTHTEIIDISKNYTPEEQKATYALIAQRKADSLRNALRIVANNRKKEGHEDDDPDTEIETQPKLPERNEHGALIALPEKVTMQMVKIKPEHMFQNEADEYMWLQCDIKVEGKQRDCVVSPKDFKGNFIFKLPNVENLIIDFNEVFQTMTPIVSYRPVENEYLAFTRTFPIEEWNDFVESRFPDLMIDDEPEEPDIPVDQKPEPEPEPKPSQESNDTEQALDEPFSLIVGTRDVGVLEEFINHELGLAMQCHAILKNQENTELWDNRKHKLIFAFNESCTPDAIIVMADQKINEYLDVEEHLSPEPIKPEEAPQQPQQEHETESIKAKTVKARVQKAKKDIKPKEKSTSEEKKTKQNYTQYDSQISKCVAGKSLSRLEIIDALGLKDRYESLDKKGKHAMEEGISKRCNVLVKNGLLLVDEITSKEHGNAHYIAKTQS